MGCKTACYFMNSPPYSPNNVDSDATYWQFKKHPTMTFQKPDLVTVRYDAVDPGPRGTLAKTAVYMFLVLTHELQGYALAGIVSICILATVYRPSTCTSRHGVIYMYM